MRKTKTFAALCALAMTLPAAAAHAAPTNQAPPAGAIFSLTGLPISATYTQYGFNFVASSATTNLTFAMRDDPDYLYLDDVVLSLAGSSTNLLVNGGFEQGPAGASSPTGWTYLNQYGAEFSGQVLANTSHTSAYAYRDGSTQAYDAITQAVATTVGSTYSVSFFERSGSAGGVYQALSTNGNTTTTGGNGVDLFVYAQGSIPVLGSAVPEASTWAMMMVGMGLVGGSLRRRRTASARVAFA